MLIMPPSWWFMYTQFICACSKVWWSVVCTYASRLAIHAQYFKLQLIFEEIKEEIWLSPMTKAPTPTEMSKEQNDNTNNATKKFDYRAVADRLRTVSWSNYDHPTGVVNLVYGPNLPTPCNSRSIVFVFH